MMFTKMELTYGQGVEDDVWILVIQSLDQDLEALFRCIRLRRHLVAQVQDQTPVLRCVCLARDTLCRPGDRVSQTSVTRQTH